MAAVIWQYKGLIDACNKIARVEGLAAFYKGLTPAIITGTPYIAIQMTAQVCTVHCDTPRDVDTQWCQYPL